MKALDSWARQFGYSDFDTYIRGGGSIHDAHRDISRRIARLREALAALPHADIRDKPPTATATIEVPHEVPDDEPPDPDNAQVQGAEHG